jgi:hypothetical protein
MFKKKPRLTQKRGSPNCPKPRYLFLLARFDAFSGLILIFETETPALIWVARLQLPFFHFDAGSGHAAQYHADACSDDRAQPSH